MDSAMKNLSCKKVLTSGYKNKLPYISRSFYPVYYLFLFVYLNSGRCNVRVSRASRHGPSRAPRELQHLSSVIVGAILTVSLAASVDATRRGGSSSGHRRCRWHHVNWEYFDWNFCLKIIVVSGIGEYSKSSWCLNIWFKSYCKAGYNNWNSVF